MMGDNSDSERSPTTFKTYAQVNDTVVEASIQEYTAEGWVTLRGSGVRLVHQLILLHLFLRLGTLRIFD